MTDLQPTAPDTSASVELSPSSTPQSPAGYKPDAEPEKKEEPKLSARQALEKAAADQNKDAEVKPEKAEPKAKTEIKAEEPKDDPKPSRERDEGGKFKGAPPPAEESSDGESEVHEEAAQEKTSEEPKSSEGKGNREPPARFLPRERDEWIKAPNIVRDATQRVIKEYETEIEASREARQNWEGLKRWDDMAKQRGVTIDRALEHYTGIDQKLSQDLVGGLDHIARQYGVDLRQVAQHVLQQPADQYQQQVTQQAQQLHQQNQQLQGQMQQMQDALRQAQEKIVHLETIQPFVSKIGQERYVELEPYIANFLNSGMIPSSLSGQQKLETAFDMAVRLFGGTQSTSSVEADPEPEAKRVNPAGQKSIKGSPASGQVAAKDKGRLSTRDAIKAAAAESGIRI